MAKRRGGRVRQGCAAGRVRGVCAGDAQGPSRPPQRPNPARFLPLPAAATRSNHLVDKVSSPCRSVDSEKICAYRARDRPRGLLSHTLFSHRSAHRPTPGRRQRPVRRSWLVGCDDDAPSHDAERDAHEARLRPTPARTTARVGRFGLFLDCWWRSSAWPPAAATPTCREMSSVKKVRTEGTVLTPNSDSLIEVNSLS